MSVLAALLLITGVPGIGVRAQGCEAALTQARDRYAAGAFEEVEAFVTACLRADGATTEDSVQAYRLQALAFLRLRDLHASTAEVLKLLGLSAAYEPDPVQDPPDYVGLVRFVKEQTRVPTPTPAEPPPLSPVEPVEQRAAVPPPLLPLPPDPDQPPPDFGAVERMPEPISRPDPEYPEMARRAGVEGRVVVRAWVDEDGVVREVQLLSGLNALLDQTAISAVGRWTFSPAMQRGRPVSVWVTVPLTFRLN